MKRQSIFLSEMQVAALKQVADVTGISLSEVIRRAIDDFIVKSRTK